MQGDVRSDADKPDAMSQSGPAAESVLRATREQQQLSVDDVAHSLHLSRELILGLEAGDFATLGPPVFVRGYLRNYARLLEIPEHQVLAGLPAADLEPEEFRTMSLKTELKPGVNLHGWLLWSSIGLILLIAAIFLLIKLQDSTAEQSAAVNSVAAKEVTDRKIVATIENAQGVDDSAASDEPASQAAVDPVMQATDSTDGAAAAADTGVDSQATLTADAEQPSANLSASSASDAASDSPVMPAEPIPAVPTDVPAVNSPAADTVTLTLTFSDECWVEVADSRRSLLYGLEKRGAVVELEGVPPFKLFLGNRQAVQIKLGGKPYTIPAGAADAGNTTRFTIKEVPL